MAKKGKMSARGPMSPPMTCASGSCGPRCVLWGLIAVILAALGLWMLMSGIMKQWSMAPWTTASLWYLGGFILWCLAKCSKLKACDKCAR